MLNGALAFAQAPSFQNAQRTTGIVGITAGQTARLHVLYPRAPAPILQVLCTVSLGIADDQGNNLKSKEAAQLTPGKSFSLDLNADTDLAGTPRAEVYGFSVAANRCRVVTNLEIIDNATQKTIAVIRGEPTYPAAIALPVEPPGNPAVR